MIDKTIKRILLFVLFIFSNLLLLFWVPLIFLAKLIVSFFYGTLCWLLDENETWVQSFRSSTEFFDLYDNPWGKDLYR